MTDLTKYNALSFASCVLEFTSSLFLPPFFF
jgi:hypothetical protein